MKGTATEIREATEIFADTLTTMERRVTAAENVLAEYADLVPAVERIAACTDTYPDARTEKIANALTDKAWMSRFTAFVRALIDGDVEASYIVARRAAYGSIHALMDAYATYGSRPNGVCEAHASFAGYTADKTAKGYLWDVYEMIDDSESPAASAAYRLMRKTKETDSFADAVRKAGELIAELDNEDLAEALACDDVVAERRIRAEMATLAEIAKRIEDEQEERA